MVGGVPRGKTSGASHLAAYDRCGVAAGVIRAFMPGSTQNACDSGRLSTTRSLPGVKTRSTVWPGAIFSPGFSASGSPPTHCPSMMRPVRDDAVARGLHREPVQVFLQVGQLLGRLLERDLGAGQAGLARHGDLRLLRLSRASCCFAPSTASYTRCLLIG